MKNKGGLYGLASGLFWGLDSVVLGLALSSVILINLGSKASLITTFIHDGFSFFMLVLLLLKMNKVSEFLKVLKSKAGLAIMLAALLGGPIGMGAYILSINYLGSTLASSISAIYPAIGLVLAYIFLKEKMKLGSIFGLFIAIIAIILMGITSDININNMYLGILFSMICIFGWGSEAVIINAALKEDVSSEVALAIRQMVTFLIYGLVIMPIIGFSNVAVVLNSFNLLIIVALSGIIGTLSYLFYYKAIDMIGATQAMGLNISYPAWAFIFQFVIDKQFSLYMFILAIIIMIGSILSNDNPKEILEIFKVGSIKNE